MRTLLINYISFAAIVTVIACNKLVEHPAGTIVAAQFYKTQADALAAVNAVYTTLNSDPAGDFPMYGRQLNLLTDNATDNQNFSPSNTNPDVRAMSTVTYVSSNGRILKNWQQHYYGINRANIAVDGVSGTTASVFATSGLQARLIGEAKFIRALLYFNLVRLFGPVPLILHNPTGVDISLMQVARNSRDSVYAQIVSDLQDAAAALPASYPATDLGRVTSGAAHALLAKVYVTRQDWGSAQTELLKVLTAGTFAGATGNYGYGLFTNYKDAFAKATKNGVEHVFSVQYQTLGGEVGSTQYLSQSFTSFNTGTYPIDIPSDSSVSNLFASTDTRKAVTFYTSQLNPATGQTVVFKNPYTPYFNKFVDYTITPLNNQTTSGINFPVIRYAEVLLLYAEVSNELGGPGPDAYTAINLVRARAGVPALTTGLGVADFRDSVFVERRKEFIQEGQRWFDLVRRGGAYYLAAQHRIAQHAAATLTDTLYPIPITEIQLDPLLTQNPGW